MRVPAVGVAPERQRLGRIATVLMVVTAVLVLAALALSFAGRSRTAGPARRSTVPRVGGPSGPSLSVATPAATGHDEPGAIATARSIVSMEPALVAGDDASAVQLVSSWSASSATSGLVDQVRRDRAGFAQAPGGPYSFEVAPLAAKANSAGADDVTVQLWCAEVVFAKAKPSYGSYVTETLHLVWQGGTWRLVTTVDTPGPAVPIAPGKAPTSIEEATSKLAGFGPVGLLESRT
jgi:hypothetical protein